MVQKHLADHAAALAGDHIEHAGRQPGFCADAGEGERGQRRGAGGLQDHGAAGRKGRGDLARDHGGREIPRRDRSDHANGLPHHPQPLPGHGRWDDFAVGAAGLLREPAEVAGRKRDLPLGFFKRLAVLFGDQPGQFVAPLGQQLVDAPQDLPAFQRRCRRPLREGLRGFVTRLPHVVAARIGQVGQRFACGGIGDAHRFAARRADPCPTHVHPRPLTDDTHTAHSSEIQGVPNSSCCGAGYPT